MKQKKIAKQFSTHKFQIITFGMLQLSLLISALVDIYKRPFYQIKGTKRIWASISFINIVGPLTYFIFGRKTHVERPDFL